MICGRFFFSLFKKGTGGFHTLELSCLSAVQTVCAAISDFGEEQKFCIITYGMKSKLYEDLKWSMHHQNSELMLLQLCRKRILCFLLSYWTQLQVQMKVHAIVQPIYAFLNLLRGHFMLNTTLIQRISCCEWSTQPFMPISWQQTSNHYGTTENNKAWPQCSLQSWLLKGWCWFQVSNGLQSAQFK